MDISRDYQAHFVQTFSPQAYLERCRNISWRYQFYMKCVHETLESGNSEGTSCLEVGCGPFVFLLASASRWYRELVTSDYVQENRDAVERWLRQDPEAMDFSSELQFVATLEGCSDPAVGGKAIEARLRSKLKSVVFCDVLVERVVPQEVYRQYDAVISSLCLESACPNVASVSDALRNISALLRRGGLLLLMGAIGATWWKTGEFTYPSLPLDKDILEESLQSTGFRVLRWEKMDRPAGQRKEEEFYDTVYFLAAEKL